VISHEEPRHFKEIPFYPRCDFSEKILPIDDDDVDGTECIYET